MIEFKPYDPESGRKSVDEELAVEASEVPEPDVDRLALETSERSDIRAIVSDADTKMGAIKGVRTVLQAEAEAGRAAVPQTAPKPADVTSAYIPSTDYLVAKAVVELLWQTPTA